MGARRQGIVALLLACVVGAGAGLASPADARDPPPPIEQVRYRAAPDQVVAAFHRIYPEFADQEDTPLLEVHGDGMVRVHHPAFMKHAGRYELRLEPGEMAELMRMLTGAVIGFDGREVRRLQREAEFERWNAAQRLEDVTIEHVADATVSRFEIEVESYRPAGAGADLALAGPRSASWRALAFDAERYPDIAALAALSAAERKLVELSLDPRLQPADASP